ncbi:MAG: MBL fold metallo-hydrolase [Aureispira sp.]|nr:MBL fold metallo-hydrolase [Aureispira sp.]
MKLLQAGCCYGQENIVLKGGRFKRIKFPALVGVFQHPKHGVILFDTGYTKRFAEETNSLPNKLFAWMLPHEVAPHQTALAQVQNMGFSASDVKYIIVSHFHADHVCGLSDFPEATIVCSKDAYANIRDIDERKALQQGVLTGLIPEDLEQRVWLYDGDERVKSMAYRPFKKVHDLFGDGSIVLFPLPGHQTGQIGALVQSEKEPMFLIADACWLSKAYKEMIMPSSLTKFLISDFKAYEDTLDKLNQFYRLYPDIPMIPSHCLETINRFG